MQGNIRPFLEEIVADRDHWARKQFEDLACECECPLSSTVVPILFQYIAQALEMPKYAIINGVKLWEQIDRKGVYMAGKNRIYLAAGFTYLVGKVQGCPRSQWAIAQVVRTSPNSIRKNYRLLMPFLGAISPEREKLLLGRESYFSKKSDLKLEFEIEGK